MRTIDADELKKQIHSHHWDIYDNIDEVYKIMDNAPTIEPKRGKWVETSHKDKKRCSVCDRICFIAIYPHFKNSASYCPNCGARMDGASHET